MEMNQTRLKSTKVLPHFSPLAQSIGALSSHEYFWNRQQQHKNILQLFLIVLNNSFLTARHDDAHLVF